MASLGGLTEDATVEDTGTEERLEAVEERGDDPLQDYLRVVQLENHACDDETRQGCAPRAGEHDPRELGQTLEFYRQACEGGRMFGCNNLGLMYRNALGVERDDGRAAELYRQACDGGHALACDDLELLLAADHRSRPPGTTPGVTRSQIQGSRSGAR